MNVTVKAKVSPEWEKAVQKIASLGGVRGVKIGIVEKATNSHTGENIAFYAACNEFGTNDIPARPFMRMTAEKHSHEWARLVRAVTKDKWVTNPNIARLALERVGDVGYRDMRAMILSNMPPPNAKPYAAWKAKKPGSEAGGYAGTLVYTGQMLQSVFFRVYGANERDD